VFNLSIGTRHQGDEMEAYQYADREYFKAMDEAATKDNFVERRQAELLDSLKYGDVMQIKRVIDNINWDVGNPTMEVIAVLLAAKKPAEYTPIETMFRALIDGAVNAIIAEEIEGMKDDEFENQYPRMEAA
jgi:hypothetical protein